MLPRVAFLLSLLLTTLFASAEPSLSVQVGWGGLHRVSDWTPLYITLKDYPDDPAPGTVEFWAYQDARYTLVHRASFPLQSRHTTFILPVTMGSLVEAHSVIVRHQSSGKIIASLGLGDLPTPEVQNITTATRLVAISGTSTGGVMPGDLLGAFTPILRLPDTPQLYESLDLLTLNADTLESLSTAQASAIAQWVRAGGRLLICLPPEGLAQSHRISEILPAGIGPLKTYAPTLTGRTLFPDPDATTLSLPKNLTGVRKNYGFGWVAILPVPLTPDSRPAAAALVGEIKPRVMLEPPAIPSRTESSLPTLALTLLAIGIILGPVEAIVRRAHNQWPWRWWTRIGFALFGIGVLLHQFAPTTQPTLAPSSLTDIVNNTLISHANTDPNRTLVTYPLLLVPPNLRGTDHLTAHIEHTFLGPEIRRPPTATAILDTTLSPGFRLPHTLTLQPGAVLLSLPPPPANAAPIDEVLLESSAGIQPARLDPTPPTADAPHTTRWIFDGPLSPTLPESFARARRLTPLRSGQLQPRITSNEVRVLWTRSGTFFTRTLLLP